MARKKTFKVEGELHVDDKGTLKKTGREAKQAGKGVKELGKETDKTTYATKKGTIQTANSTKNFANMARGVTGGIVPAYATLAAQIFALGAAFRFLSEAADYRMLKEGQIAFGMATGVAYASLTKRIIEATDAQITFKDAAQAVAIGTAAGLSPSQLERLGAAAKQVSIALGRDLVDSFNRLIRGTTKAEPELLDELGIILRLEIATKKYAAALGKSKEELSTFEKTQAVTNEVLGQAEDKYSKINAIMDPSTNAFNKFAKSFDDLTNVLKGFLAKYLEPLAIYFSKNMVTFGLGMALFAGQIIKLMVPALTKWGDKMRDITDRNQRNLKRQRQNLQDAVKEDKKAMQRRQENYERAQKKYASTATKYGGAGNITGRGIAGEKKALDHAQNQIDKGVKTRTGRYAKADQDIINSQRRRLKIMVKGEIGYLERSKAAINSWKMHYKVAMASVKSAFVSFKGAMIGLATKMGRAMNLAFKLSGILFLVSMIVDATRALIKWINPVDKAIEDAKEKVKDFIEAQKTLHGEIKKMSIVWARQAELLQTYKERIEFLGNAVNSADIYGSMKSIQEAMIAGAPTEHMTNAFAITLATLSRLDEEFMKYAFELANTGHLSEEAGKELLKLSAAKVEDMQKSKALTEAYKQVNLEINNQVNSYAKMPFEKILKQYALIEEYTDAADKETQDLLEVVKLLNKELTNMNDRTLESKKRSLAYDIQAAKLGTDGTKAGKLQKDKLAYLKQEEIWTQKLMKLKGLEYQLFITQDKEKRRSLELAIDAGKLELELEIQKLEIAKQRLNIWAQAGEQAKGKLESGVAGELKALIMKENTSVKEAVKNIAESLHETVAQGMADVLTNQIMKGLFGDESYNTAFNAHRDALGLYLPLKDDALQEMKKGGGTNKGLIGGLWDKIFNFGVAGGGDQKRKKLILSNEKLKEAAKLKADIDKKLGTEKNPMFVRIDKEGIAEMIAALQGKDPNFIGPPKPVGEELLGDLEMEKKIWKDGKIDLSTATEGMPMLTKAIESTFVQGSINLNNLLSSMVKSLFGFGAKGGYVRKYAGGTGPAGAKFVPGTGNRDSVPSLLTPGEIVIPKGKRVGGNYNTTINVNMEGGGDVTTDDDTGEALGMALQQAVTEEIAAQQRPGGLLSPFGG